MKNRAVVVISKLNDRDAAIQAINGLHINASLSVRTRFIHPREIIVISDGNCEQDAENGALIAKAAALKSQIKTVHQALQSQPRRE